MGTVNGGGTGHEYLCGGTRGNGGTLDPHRNHVISEMFCLCVVKSIKWNAILLRFDHSTQT